MHRLKVLSSLHLLEYLVVSLCHSDLVTWEQKAFRKYIAYLILSSNIYPVCAHPLEENEVRTMVDPNSKNDRKLQELMKVKLQWFNLPFILDV